MTKDDRPIPYPWSPSGEYACRCCGVKLGFPRNPNSAAARGNLMACSSCGSIWEHEPKPGDDRHAEKIHEHIGNLRRMRADSRREKAR